MGNWNISIQGCGCHHNKMFEKDANRMSAKFVQDLIDAGHSIEFAKFTYGGMDHILDGKKYLDTRDEFERSH